MLKKIDIKMVFLASARVSIVVSDRDYSRNVEKVAPVSSSSYGISLNIAVGTNG